MSRTLQTTPQAPAAAGNGLQHRVDLEPECLAPERIQLDHEQLGPFGFKQREEARLTHPFDRLDVIAGSCQELLELRVHAELGQAQLADVARELHLEPRPAGDQDHLVAGERPADLQAAEKVPHTEHMLAVEYDLHAHQP